MCRMKLLAPYPRFKENVVRTHVEVRQIVRDPQQRLVGEPVTDQIQLVGGSSLFIQLLAAATGSRSARRSMQRNWSAEAIGRV